jgi:hypothetical protein
VGGLAAIPTGKRTEKIANTGPPGLSASSACRLISAFRQKLAVQAPDAAGFGAHILQSIMSETTSWCESGASRDCAATNPAPACRTMNDAATIQQMTRWTKFFRMP